MDQGLYKHSYKSPQRSPAALAVYNTGLQRCSGGYAWGPGVRDHYLIHWILSGHGQFVTRNETYTPSAGMLFLSCPGDTIFYQAHEQDPWEYCWVGFNGADAPLLLEQTRLTRQSPLLRPENPEKIRRAMLDIYADRGSLPHQAVAMTGALYRFFALLMEESFGRETPGAQQVRRACAFIADHFSTPLSVEEIAEEIGLSRSRLYRLFMEHLGLSPADYVTQFRMERSQSLLQSTSLPIKAVAFSVGYSDPLYFSRRFREAVGMSPLEYRRKFSVPH